MVTERPQIIQMDRHADAEINDVLLLNVTFYSNDDLDVSVEWYRVNNMSSASILSGRQRYNYSITESKVHIMFRSTLVPLPGNFSQLAISPVQLVDFTNFEVRIINSAGTAVSSIAVVPKGKTFLIIYFANKRNIVGHLVCWNNNKFMGYV